MNMFKETNAKTPDEYIAALAEPRRSEMQRLHDFIQSVIPDLKPHIMTGMIGYGSYHYRSSSGREGEWSVVALASQKNYISVYVCGVVDGAYVAEQNKDHFPKASIGKSCIRFKRVDDIDLTELKRIILLSVEHPMGG